MQFKALALSALVAAVSAQDQAGSPTDVASIIQVLKTALPSSVLQEALTNSAALVSQVSSQFAAGSTPTWYSDLPSDLQTYLNPTETSQAISMVSEVSQSLSDMPMVTEAPYGNGTNATTTRAGGAASTGGMSGAADMTSSDSGAVPTGVYGMGLAGAVGLVGLMAL